MSEEKKGPREKRKLRFARAYADPMSPTFNKVAESYQAAKPGTELENARKAGGRLLDDPVVREEMARVQALNRVVTGGEGGAEEYARRAMEITEFLLKRGERGDSTAASKFFELAGKAQGFLIMRTEDMTPFERKAGVTREELKELLRERLNRMDELDQPNPLPQLQSGPPAPAADAEFTILPDDEDEQ